MKETKRERRTAHLPSTDETNKHVLRESVEEHLRNDENV